MNKILSTLAIVGLGATLAAGAQAQTVLSSQDGLYTLTVTDPPQVTQLGANDYRYTYTAVFNTSVLGSEVDQFSISPIAGAIANTAFTQDEGLTFTNFAPSLSIDSTTGFGIANYTATPGDGLLNNGDTEEFGFQSTLPDPTATVFVDANGSSSAAGSDLGPAAATTAVPEAGSFALLGLGLLPLGLIARRRISRSN